MPIIPENSSVLSDKFLERLYTQARDELGHGPKPSTVMLDDEERDHLRALMVKLAPSYTQNKKYTQDETGRIKYRVVGFFRPEDEKARGPVKFIDIFNKAKAGTLPELNIATIAFGMGGDRARKHETTFNIARVTGEKPQENMVKLVTLDSKDKKSSEQVEILEIKKGAFNFKATESEHQKKGRIGGLASQAKHERDKAEKVVEKFKELVKKDNGKRIKKHWWKNLHLVRNVSRLSPKRVFSVKDSELLESSDRPASEESSPRIRRIVTISSKIFIIAECNNGEIVTLIDPNGKYLAEINKKLASNRSEIPDFGELIQEIRRNTREGKRAALQAPEEGLLGSLDGLARQAPAPRTPVRTESPLPPGPPADHALAVEEARVQTKPKRVRIVEVPAGDYSAARGPSGAPRPKSSRQSPGSTQRDK